MSQVTRFLRALCVGPRRERQHATARCAVCHQCCADAYAVDARRRRWCPTCWGEG